MRVYRPRSWAPVVPESVSPVAVHVLEDTWPILCPHEERHPLHSGGKGITAGVLTLHSSPSFLPWEAPVVEAPGRGDPYARDAGREGPRGVQTDASCPTPAPGKRLSRGHTPPWASPGSPAEMSPQVRAP